MIALALSLALLAYWGVLGLAVLSVLYTGRRSCQRLLLAPAVGIVVLAFPTYWLNQAGLAVGRFGPALGVVLLLGSLAVLAWRRPLVPGRHVAPLVAAVLAGVVLTARPMLSFGFDWVSFANDDMANYCLLAQRLLTRGFSEPPASGSIARGLDYAGYYWTYHMGGVRPGTDLVLAWLASVTRLGTQQAFMPCIVALHGALIAAVTALVYRTRRHRPGALLAGWLLAVAAMVSLGTLYQLIAQVLGLVLLAALVTVLLPPAWSARPRRLVAHGALAGLLGAGLLLGYPEIVPFAGVAIVVHLALEAWRRRLPARTLLGVLVPAAAVASLLLQTRAITAVGFLLAQSGAGVSGRDPSETIFPYFLLPSGLAQLAGLRPISGVTAEPWGSLTIVAGAVFALLTLAAALRLSWRGEPVALVAATMLGVGIGLYVRGADFGLFKLAMFLQPFMVGTLAVAGALGRRRGSWAVLFLVFTAGNLWVQADYVDQSRGHGVMSELRGASANQLGARFGRAVAAARPAALDLDTANVVLAKLLVQHLDRIPSTFLARDFFFNIRTNERYKPGHRVKAAEAYASFTRLVGVRRSLVHFPLLNGAGEENLFSAPAPGTTAERVPGGALVLSAGTQSVLNRRSLGRESAPVLIRPYREVANHLVFMHSRLGQHYFGYEERARIALFQLEADPQYPGRTMAAVGRHLVFRVVNPGRPVRLAVTLSASFKGDGQNRLPPAAAIGEARVPLPLVGSGSARVFSPILAPRDVEGHPYVAIDMNVDGAMIDVPRRGLLGLYGRDVAIDSRRIVAFARDISLVPDEEYRALEPPHLVSRLPQDLANPSLEYSGIYEDGWIAEHAYLRLARAPGADVLAIRGRAQPGPPQELVVLVDGREAGRQAIASEFTTRVAAPPGPGRARIDLRVSPLWRLGSPDGRQVGLLLHSIEFQP